MRKNWPLGAPVQLVDDIETQGYSVLDEFLSENELMAINQAFDCWREQNLFTPAKIGKEESLQLKSSIRGDETWWFDVVQPPQELRPVLAKVDFLKNLLNQSLFLGLKDWEVHLASYAPGAFYRKHLDRHSQSTRKLSVIIYLNQNWRPQDGGELIIYSKNDEELVRVSPVGGRIVAFLSEEFPHEVLPAMRERRSLTGWFLDAPRML
jgi:SM-20-related protein